MAKFNQNIIYSSLGMVPLVLQAKSDKKNIFPRISSFGLATQKKLCLLYKEFS